MTEEDIIKIIENDEEMMQILQEVKKLNLPDWWIGAGFVRSRVWDHLHGYTTKTPFPDIDIIYLDNSLTADEHSIPQIKAQEKIYEEKLRQTLPQDNWSVTNEARMHLKHGDAPYKSSEEALSHWVETATCIGVKLDEKDELLLTTPHGIEDLTNLILRPSPGYENRREVFNERIKKKNWLQKWPKLKIILAEENA